jgi:hypothetical protein
MSSLHNDLDTWASKSIAQGNDRIEILNSTAHEIAETLREHQQLRDAMFKPEEASGHYQGDGGQRSTREHTRPQLRDCQFCHAKGDDSETILFTMEFDVIDHFAYSYTIRCCSCGSSLTDEYESEVICLWNGLPKVEEEDDAA